MTYPTHYDIYSNTQLMRAMREGPGRLRASVAGLDEEQLRATPIEGKWSIFQIMIHLADAEVIGAARFRFAIAERGYDSPVYEQDDWAANLAYSKAPLEAFYQSLDLLAELSAANVRLLESIPEARWSEFWVRHSAWGRLDLRQLLELYADHRERHLEQILERRRLLGARSLEIPLILETRLY